ncbi:hypothetical protein FRC03_006339 [Tulasnella sp. 419]|nr:hypothetical protein FRC03_006339 [Tulasnella sp. 419]
MSVPSTPPPSENCTIGFDGQLLDASKIKWFNSPSNENPIPFEQSDLKTEKSKSADVDDGFQEPIGRGHRSKKLTGKAAMMQEIQVSRVKRLGSTNSKNQQRNIKVQEPSKKQAKHVPKKCKKVNSASNNVSEPEIVPKKNQSNGDMDIDYYGEVLEVPTTNSPFDTSQPHNALHEELTFLKFKQLKADPCVYVYHNNDKIVVMCVYVDDGIMFGTKELLDIVTSYVKD